VHHLANSNWPQIDTKIVLVSNKNNKSNQFIHFLHTKKSYNDERVSEMNYITIYYIGNEKWYKNIHFSRCTSY